MVLITNWFGSKQDGKVCHHRKPSVVKLDQQIASVKSTVVESLLRLQSTLNIQKKDLNRNEGLWILKFGKYQFKNVSLG
jgi:hypothetical protein